MRSQQEIINIHSIDLIALEQSTVGAPIEIGTMAQQAVGRNNRNLNRK